MLLYIVWLQQMSLKSSHGFDLFLRNMVLAVYLQLSHTSVRVKCVNETIVYYEPCLWFVLPVFRLYLVCVLDFAFEYYFVYLCPMVLKDYYHCQYYLFMPPTNMTFLIILHKINFAMCLQMFSVRVYLFFVECA